MPEQNICEQCLSFINVKVKKILEIKARISIHHTTVNQVVDIHRDSSFITAWARAKKTPTILAKR